jgi:hypothetical protein
MKVTKQVISTYLPWKEEQRNLTVKHNLCYWMSNEPRIKTIFFTKYNELPKLPVIKETVTDIQHTRMVPLSGLPDLTL